MVFSLEGSGMKPRKLTGCRGSRLNKRPLRFAHYASSRFVYTSPYSKYIGPRATAEAANQRHRWLAIAM